MKFSVQDLSGPADTMMMGVMHDALRRDFTRARDALAAPDVVINSRATALAEHIGFMLAFLHEHHHSEDEKLWPLVRNHDPALVPLMEEMSGDHAAIAAEVDQLTGAAHTFGRSPDAGSRAELVAAIDRLTTVLWPHLDREETELMPLVSNTLSAAQWQEFEKSATPPFSTRVLAEYLNWFLEGLDPTRRRKVLQGLPAPIALVSTRVFGGGYRRRAAVRWGTTESAGHAGRQKQQMNPAVRRAGRVANTAAVWLYRRSGGRIGGSAKGIDVLLLTVVGRKTGKPFTVPVVYFPHDTGYVIAGSAGGMKRDPQWVHNLRAAGHATLEIGRDVIPVQGHVTDGAQRERLWNDVVLAQAPFFMKYQQKAGRVIPVATLVPHPARVDRRTGGDARPAPG